MAENKNHLGLDKFQIAVIKSNYNSTKPIRKIVEKSQAKIDAAKTKLDEVIASAKAKYEETVKDLQAEVNAYTDQIAMLDKFTTDITTKTCGISLTSEQVMEFIENPDAFNAYKHELGLDNDMFETKDLDAEEDKEWEDRIQSGELKEVV